MKPKLIVYNINWETDGETIDLPVKVEIPFGVKAHEVADWLSDKYGWCINSLDLKYL